MSVQLFTYKETPLTKVIRASANLAGVQFEETKLTPMNVTKFYNENSPYQKLPVLKAAGATLFDSAAIINFIGNMRAENPAGGATAADKAVVAQYVNFAANEVINQYEKISAGNLAQNRVAMKIAVEYLKKLDTHFVSNTYVVGKNVTVADFTLAAALLEFYQSYAGPAAQGVVPNLTRFFFTIVNHPVFVKEFGKIEATTSDDYFPPPPPMPKVDDKPVRVRDTSKVATLPKSSMNLEDVKRKYGLEQPFNTQFFNDTDGFWTYFDKEGYSIYYVEYAYPEDWEKLFMAANQITGFINRSEGIKKHAFLNLHLYCPGENQVHCKGAMIIRGANEEGMDAFYEASMETEEYKFVKLDSDKPEDRATFEKYFTPTDIDGFPIENRQALK